MGISLGKIWGFHWEKYGDFTGKNGDFTGKNGD
jgi:hypothetical protein